MSFADLDPVERVALAQRHLAELSPLPGAPRLDVRTLERMQAVKLALVDDDVSDEDFLELLGEWDEHLGTLSPHEADAASFELKQFGRILEGLRPVREEVEPEA